MTRLSSSSTGKRTVSDYLAVHLRHILAQRKISQTRFADMVQRQDGSIYQRLNGSVTISVDDLVAFAEALEIPAVVLLASAIEAAADGGYTARRE